MERVCKVFPKILHTKLPIDCKDWNCRRKSLPVNYSPVPSFQFQSKFQPKIKLIKRSIEFLQKFSMKYLNFLQVFGQKTKIGDFQVFQRSFSLKTE